MNIETRYEGKEMIARGFFGVWDRQRQEKAFISKVSLPEKIDNKPLFYANNVFCMVKRQQKNSNSCILIMIEFLNTMNNNNHNLQQQQQNL